MPEHKIGNCPWCGRKDVNLYMVSVFAPQEGPVALYVCYRCIDSLNAIQETRERAKQND